MRLTEILRLEHVVAPLEATSAHAAVRVLTERLVQTGAVTHPEQLERLFTENRVRDLIHIGNRILLPHLRTDAVSQLVVAIGVAEHPLPVSTNDPRESAQILVLVLAPTSAADLYLQTVAALARALRHDTTAEQLAAARSPAEVLAVPELRELIVQPRLTVRDVMTQRAYRVSPETPIRELLHLVSLHKLRAVPVVGENREVLGIVTDRDILRHLLPNVLRFGTGEAGGPSPHEGSVRDIMTRSVMCISEDQALAEVASIMVNKDVERLPVVSEGRLTGFLTRGDIIRKLFTF